MVRPNPCSRCRFGILQGEVGLVSAWLSILGLSSDEGIPALAFGNIKATHKIDETGVLSLTDHAEVGWRLDLVLTSDIVIRSLDAVTNIETWDLNTVHMFMGAVSALVDCSLQFNEGPIPEFAVSRLTGVFILKLL